MAVVGENIPFLLWLLPTILFDLSMTLKRKNKLSTEIGLYIQISPK